MEYELVERPRQRETPPALVAPRQVPEARRAAPYWQGAPAARDCAIAIPEQEWGA